VAEAMRAVDSTRSTIAVVELDRLEARERRRRSMVTRFGFGESRRRSVEQASLRHRAASSVVGVAQVDRQHHA
jgi:hypothetical protein